jgi:hypothetical protein
MVVNSCKREVENSVCLPPLFETAVGMKQNADRNQEGTHLKSFHKSSWYTCADVQQGVQNHVHTETSTSETALDCKVGFRVENKKAGNSITASRSRSRSTPNNSFQIGACDRIRAYTNIHTKIIVKQSCIRIIHVYINTCTCMHAYIRTHHTPYTMLVYVGTWGAFPDSTSLSRSRYRASHLFRNASV